MIQMTRCLHHWSFKRHRHSHLKRRRVSRAGLQSSLGAGPALAHRTVGV